MIGQVDIFKEARDVIASKGLVYLLQEEGYQVSNRSFKCIFPEHEDSHPSASITPDGLLYKCFSCGQDAMDGIALLAKLRSISPLASASYISGIDTNNPSIKRRISKPRTIKTKPAPVNHSYPSRLGLSEEALSVLKHFWQLVKEQPLNAYASKLLSDRGLDPAKCHKLGVRSITQGLDQKLLQHHGKEAVAEAGFGSDYFLKSDGALVPVWCDPDIDYPLAWRVRRYDSKIKTLGMKGRGSIPLGIYSMEYGVPSPAYSITNKPQVLIITEGEPDYLTIATTLKEKVAIIGLQGHTFPSWLPSLICGLKYKHIIDLTHIPKTKAEIVGIQLKDKIAKLPIPIEDKPKITLLIQHEKHDLNDQLQDGTLESGLLNAVYAQIYGWGDMTTNNQR
jgi:hypothetical protein